MPHIHLLWFTKDLGFVLLPTSWLVVTVPQFLVESVLSPAGFEIVVGNQRASKLTSDAAVVHSHNTAIIRVIVQIFTINRTVRALHLSDERENYKID